MPSFSEFAKDQRKPLPLALIPQAYLGAAYIVTEANTGLGFECVKHLASLSSKRVNPAVHSLKKGKDVKAKIKAASC